MNIIFFYSNHREHDQTIGITQKVHGEIDALRTLGYTVFYSAYIEDGVGIFNNSNELVYRIKYPTQAGRLNRLIRRGLLLKCCVEYLRSAQIKFDIGYLRFHFFDHKYLSLIKTLRKRKALIIVEAHAYPYRYWNNIKLWPIYILDVMYEKRITNLIDIVAIMGKVEKPWGIEAIQIDNGIDLNKYPIKANTKDEEIRLISVTNEHTGHAYYKVINGLSDYYQKGGTKKIKINLVGEYMDSTKRLIEEDGLDQHVVFWGKMYGEKLNEVFNESDIGLGAFSHRSNDSGSCIKTKEYFARGIPFVNGWREPAFDDTYPYVLRFDTKLDKIDFNKIIEFYERLSDLDKVSREMRTFAEENYTWETQMKKVLFEVEKRI